MASKMWRSLLALPLLWAGMAGAAGDEMPADPGQTDWACGAPVALPKDRLAELVAAAEIVGGRGPQGGADFLVMDLHDLGDGMIFGGVVLAMRQASTWRTYAVESGGDAYAAKATADGAHQILVSMLSRGGPGSSYTVVVGERGFHNRTCATIPFPDTLNQPNWANEYLQLDALNGAAGKKLVLDGHALVDIDGVEATEYYAYESADGGRSWSSPKRLDAAPAAPAGDFSDLGPVPDLVADFLREAQ